jgi:hypothetical protein
MYALLLWAIPMGLIAAARPEMAKGIADGMNAYLAGIPEPLYALFGTGYLGYTAARGWSTGRRCSPRRRSRSSGCGSLPFPGFLPFSAVRAWRGRAPRGRG